MVPVGAAFCSEAPSSPSVEKVIIKGWVVAVEKKITKTKIIFTLQWLGA